MSSLEDVIRLDPVKEQYRKELLRAVDKVVHGNHGNFQILGQKNEKQFREMNLAFLAETTDIMLTLLANAIARYSIYRGIETHKYAQGLAQDLIITSQEAERHIEDSIHLGKDPMFR